MEAREPHRGGGGRKARFCAESPAVCVAEGGRQNLQEGVATTSELDTVVRTTFGFRLPFFGSFAIADMAGLDVYMECFKTVEKAYGSRMAMPDLLAEMLQKGAHGVKNGKGFYGDYSPEKQAALVAYRNKAYAKLLELLEELGPSPLEAS